jgi:hypothetical protein
MILFDIVKGTRNADEQNNPDTRRCRFIAPTADLSALAAFPAIPIHLFICITGSPEKGSTNTQ